MVLYSTYDYVNLLVFTIFTMPTLQIADQRRQFEFLKYVQQQLVPFLTLKIKVNPTFPIDAPFVSYEQVDFLTNNILRHSPVPQYYKYPAT